MPPGVMRKGIRIASYTRVVVTAVGVHRRVMTAGIQQTMMKTIIIRYDIFGDDDDDR